jgi:hypothetical protein
MDSSRWNGFVIPASSATVPPCEREGRYAPIR